MAEQAPVNSLPEHVQLIQKGIALWESKILVAAAQLGIADRLSVAPRTSDDLADELQLHPRSLYRFMRTLAGMGLLTEVSSKAFGLTPLGQALRADAPGSARDDSDIGWSDLQLVVR
jgi:hypothetical protein